MKKIIIIFLIVLAALSLFYFWNDRKARKERSIVVAPDILESEETILDKMAQSDIEIAVDKLKIPWSLVFLPDGSMIVTERPGNLRKIGGEEFAISIPDVAARGEGGILGVAIHPDFSQNNWIYLYYTKNTGGRINNVVERYVLLGSQLNEKKVIMENIPSSANHNGGRIAFGPDGFLYVTTGDAENSNNAQDKNSLAGKILRVAEDGSIPSDNPFGNAAYSLGHRNPQGLIWDDLGRLWSTEHGRSGNESGLDELNLIEKGKNFGWPIIQGDETRAGLETAVVNSGPDVTWAPGGIIYSKGSIFFVGLRGEALYEAKINSSGRVEKMETHFQKRFGRLRDIVIGPDGNFYVLTSNTDGRGVPKAGDDKIIKINRAMFQDDARIIE